jgi:hypothetical protein
MVNATGLRGRRETVLAVALLVATRISEMQTTQAQQCDITSQRSELEAAFGSTVEDSIYAPFHEACANDIAYGNAYNFPVSSRTCAMTQISQRFNSLSMNVCDSIAQDTLQAFDDSCTSTSGMYCSTSAIVTGQMSRSGISSSPEFTYVNIDCIPTCLPSDCSAADNENAVLKYLSEDVILPILKQQGFVVQELDALVPYAQCSGSGSTGANEPDEVFTTLDNHPFNETFYQVGSALVLALCILFVVAYFAFVVMIYCTNRDEKSDNDSSSLHEMEEGGEDDGEEKKEQESRDEIQTTVSTSGVVSGFEKVP